MTYEIPLPSETVERIRDICRVRECSHLAIVCEDKLCTFYAIGTEYFNFFCVRLDSPDFNFRFSIESIQVILGTGLLNITDGDTVTLSRIVPYKGENVCTESIIVSREIDIDFNAMISPLLRNIGTLEKISIGNSESLSDLFAISTITSSAKGGPAGVIYTQGWAEILGVGYRVYKRGTLGVEMALTTNLAKELNAFCNGLPSIEVMQFRAFYVTNRNGIFFGWKQSRMRQNPPAILYLEKQTPIGTYDINLSRIANKFKYVHNGKTQPVTCTLDFKNKKAIITTNSYTASIAFNCKHTGGEELDSLPIDFKIFNGVLQKATYLQSAHLALYERVIRIESTTGMIFLFARLDE